MEPGGRRNPDLYADIPVQCLSYRFLQKRREGVEVFHKSLRRRRRKRMERRRKRMMMRRRRWRGRGGMRRICRRGWWWRRA